MTSIIIVDDQQLVRAAIVRLLSDVNDLNVLGEASSGEAALRLVKEQKPDLILIDLNMPGIGGLATIGKILQYSSKAKIIVLSSHTQEPFPSRALQAGAKGYVTKGATLEKMLQAIKTVMANQIYLDPEIAQTLALKNVSSTAQSPMDTLAKRELQIFLEVAKGNDATTIAKKLCISSKTVNTYRYRIQKTLNIKNDVELTWFAIRHGLLVDIGSASSS